MAIFIAVFKWHCTLICLCHIFCFWPTASYFFVAHLIPVLSEDSPYKGNKKKLILK